MHFSEHGVFAVQITNHTLIVDATGPFNEELTRHYGNAIESCIQALEHKNWHQVIQLHQLSLFTPEAEAVLIETLIDRKNRGLTRSAVVLVNVEGKSWVTQQMARAYQKAGVSYAFFDDIDQALGWLGQNKEELD